MGRGNGDGAWIVPAGILWAVTTSAVITYVTGYIFLVWVPVIAGCVVALGVLRAIEEKR